MRICTFLIRAGRLLTLLITSWLFGNAMILTGAFRKYNVSADTHFRVGELGKMRIGAISKETNVHFTAWGGELKIGNHCAFNRNDIIVAHGYIEIGNDTVFGPNVCIYDHDHVFGPNGKVNGQYNRSPIHIGNNVWIGANVTILRGTTIL